jgi:hypothetical protein
MSANSGVELLQMLLRPVNSDALQSISEQLKQIPHGSLWYSSSAYINAMDRCICPSKSGGVSNECIRWFQLQRQAEVQLSNAEGVHCTHVVNRVQRKGC